MIPLHTHQDAYYQKKKQKITSVGEDVGKFEPLYVAGGNIKWCSHCGKQYGNISKIKCTITT